MALERPAFFEGQVLAAADLTSAVEYSRAEAARHDRYLHDWGIADGLELTSVAKTDTAGKYVEVTLQPGMAIDGTGREIVVPAPVRLSETDFAQVNGASPQAGAFYPVLLHGIDSDAPAPPLTIGACGPASQPTRTLESFGISFGGLGAELLLDDQPAPDVSAGPDPRPGGRGKSWPASCSGTARIRGSPRRSGAGRRYAGVKADTVAARSGTLALRAQPSPAPGQPALLVGGDPPALTFGLYKGGNTVDPRLTVSAQGDVTATGTIKGALAQGRNPGPIRHRHRRRHHPPAPGHHRGPGCPWRGDPAPAPNAAYAAVRRPGTWYVPVECSVDANRQLHLPGAWSVPA